jgi:RimJ/RimL family protein N-acetyltransferase
MDDAIRTQRLLLRPLRGSDAEALFALFNDWQVVCWLSSPPWPYALDDAHSYINGRLKQELTTTTFAITLDDALIGCIDSRTNAPAHMQRAPGPNLGYWLGQPYWRRGYMTEAARGFVAYVFASASSDTVYSGAFAGNEPSLRVQEKLGFVRDGEKMLFSRPRNEMLPHVNTKLTRAAFEASRP